MNWLPQFLNPLTAAVAAAIAVPALLVLYFLKLRRREMVVSSTLLWRKAIQDLQVNAPFQKLRRNLLLLLQLLLLILLALALSRPVVSYAPPPGKATVVLIDRSASMAAKDAEGGRTRLDEAKRRAKDLIDSLGRNAAAMVIAFDDSAATVQSFTADRATLKTAIDSIQPTDRRSRLKMAYQLAEAQMNFNPDQMRSIVEQPDVWVYSDGRVLDANELSLRGTIHFDPVGTDQAGNVAVVAMSAKRNYERPTEVQVFARLANSGPNVTSADVQLTVDGQVRAVASTTLLPERWTDDQRASAEQSGQAPRDSVEFTIDITTAAVIKVEQMNKETDQLAADDAAQVVVPPPKPLAVLLVTDGNYFLERAMASLNLNKPATLTPVAYERNVPTGYDVILFDRYRPKALPPAGGFISFGAVPQGLKLGAVREQIGGGERNVIVEDQGILDWKRDHPILR
ncbi:MAG: vWA domain-containing protein, partial [Tepidisphaeraceae bacterium]